MYIVLGVLFAHLPLSLIQWDCHHLQPAFFFGKVGLRVFSPYLALGERREKYELALWRGEWASCSIQRSIPLGELEEQLGFLKQSDQC